ncbi:MAG: branched-chain amino acid ABC transporter permease [Thermoleophilia bacterium]|nr:branched-chain amino acid ABC transporter permease [Thermoleophilia bacterium]
MATAAGVVVLVGAMAVAPNVLGSAYWFTIFTTVVINVLLASSLRTMFLIGRISLGHVGFMLVGAYTSALLSIHAGWPLWGTIPLAALVSALVGLLVAYPFLRVAGIYFAILTLLAAETVRLVAYNWKGVTGGQLGLTGIPGPGSVGVPLIGTVELGRVTGYYYLALVVVVLSLAVLYALERSDLGLKWRSIKDAEPLAQAVGVPVMAYKIANFVIACFFAGLAGALYAHAQRGLDAEATSRFGALMSMYLIVYLVVGGEGPFLGPAVGATLLTVVAQVAGFAQEYQPIVVGTLAILVTVFMPNGIVGLASEHWRRVRPPTPRTRTKEAEHAGARSS